MFFCCCFTAIEYVYCVVVFTLRPTHASWLNFSSFFFFLLKFLFAHSTLSHRNTQKQKKKLPSEKFASFQFQFTTKSELKKRGNNIKICIKFEILFREQHLSALLLLPFFLFCWIALLCELFILCVVFFSSAVIISVSVHQIISQSNYFKIFIAHIFSFPFFLPFFFTLFHHFDGNGIGMVIKPEEKKINNQII